MQHATCNIGMHIAPIAGTSATGLVVRGVVSTGAATSLGIQKVGES